MEEILGAINAYMFTIKVHTLVIPASKRVPAARSNFSISIFSPLTESFPPLSKYQLLPLTSPF